MALRLAPGGFGRTLFSIAAAIAGKPPSSVVDLGRIPVAPDAQTAIGAALDAAASPPRAALLGAVLANAVATDPYSGQSGPASPADVIQTAATHVIQTSELNKGVPDLSLLGTLAQTVGRVLSPTMPILGGLLGSLGGNGGGSQPGIGYGGGGLPMVTVTPQVGLPASQQASISAAALPGLPGVLRTLPQVLPRIGGAVAGVAGKAYSALPANVRAQLPRIARDAAIAAGLYIAGGLVYDAAGNLVGRTRRRRRMNPLNYRAAKRAARRLCAVQDLCADISKALPTRAPRARRSRRRKCR